MELRARGPDLKQRCASPVPNRNEIGSERCPSELSSLTTCTEIVYSPSRSTRKTTGAWAGNVSAGLRFDHYGFIVHESAWSPRAGVSTFVPAFNLLLHASYDRIFQTPAVENLLLASSPLLDAVSPSVLRLPVRPGRGNFYEGGVTKAFFGKLRLDANVFRRDFRQYSDDDVLLDMGVSFPIAFMKARIWGRNPPGHSPVGAFLRLLELCEPVRLRSRPDHRRVVPWKRCGQCAYRYEQIRRDARSAEFAACASALPGPAARMAGGGRAIRQRVAGGYWQRQRE